ncbi:MAG: hypothetical protein QM758_20095 [Armatimonas sp.]
MDRLSYTFYCKGQLGIDVLGIASDPIHENLCLSMAGKLYKISTIHSLENLVSIRSPAEALNFVRLITSPRTFNIMVCGDRKRRLELIPTGSITHEFYFEDAHTFRKNRLVPGSRVRMRRNFATKSPWEKYSVSPRVDSVNGYYHVRRNILREEDWYKASIWHVEEKVLSNGRYQLISQTMLLKTCHTEAFPYYE